VTNGEQIIEQGEPIRYEVTDELVEFEREING
jgi:hypothetical protein